MWTIPGRGKMTDIPIQLQKEEFRFCLIRKQSKAPFEDDWPTKGYKFNDDKLKNWLIDENNYGVIGGYGNLRIIDIDDKEIAEKVKEKLNTFTIKTGSGNGMHFYVLCDYDTNHVFLDNIGEFRAKNYQVVGPDSTHPSGNKYEVSNNTEILLISKQDLLNILMPYLKEGNIIIENQVEVDENYIKTNILPFINPFIKNLIENPQTEETLKMFGFPSRSERDQKIVSYLLLNGYGNYMQSIFEKFPCGDKYREHKAKEKYFEHSVATARKFTGVFDDFLVKLEKDIEIMNDKILKNRIDEFLEKISSIEDWMVRTQFLNLIAFKVKMKVSLLEKRVMEIKAEKTREEPIDILDLLNKPMKKAEYWIKPILPKKSLIIIGGKPESFKSMFILTALLHASSKKTLLETFVPDELDPPKILYYDLENGQELQQQRIKYVMKGNHLKIDSGFKILFAFNKNNLKKELEFCKKFDIIVLDSYRRFLEGTEDSSEITNRFFIDFLFKLRELGKTVVIIHHFRKQKLEELESGDILDAFRGSGDITAQLDIVYGVLKNNEIISMDGKNVSFDVSVIKAKVRSIHPIQNFIFKVNRDDTKEETTFNFIGFRKIVSPKEQRREAIINLLKSEEKVSRDKILLFIKDLYNCTDPTIDRDLKDLVVEGAITQPTYGFYSLKRMIDDSDSFSSDTSSDTSETETQEKL